MDEPALIAACRRGDREAQRVLYECHVERLYRLALRMTGNDQDAFDVTQDAFVRAFRRLADFDGRSALATWLYRITVNEALQHFRRRATEDRHAASLADVRARTTPPSALPDAQMDVREALERLSTDHRAVLLLKYDQGLDYAQMAEVLGCSPGTVASRLNRARAELRDILEDPRQARGVRDVPEEAPAWPHPKQG